MPTNCLIVFDYFVKLVLKGLVCILWLLASLSEIMTRYVVPLVVVLLVVLLIVIITIIRRKRNNKANDGLYSQRWDRKLFLNPTSVNQTKWSNTETICRLLTDELFKCVLPFCGVGAYRVNHLNPNSNVRTIFLMPLCSSSKSVRMFSLP